MLKVVERIAVVTDTSREWSIRHDVRERYSVTMEQTVWCSVTLECRIAYTIHGIYLTI
jgi:hypothetical protein